MKKFGINIRLFLRYAACYSDLQDLTPLAIFSNINQDRFASCLESKEDIIFGNDQAFIPSWINKKETQRFQLPKQIL